MTMTDPISDLLTRIRNAYQGKLVNVVLPYSKIKMSILQVLRKEGYVQNASEYKSKQGFKEIRVGLKYSPIGKAAIVTIDRVSKPGKRIYSSISDLKEYYKGLGIYILSTSRGVVSDREAAKFGVGGEVLCKIF